MPSRRTPTSSGLLVTCTALAACTLSLVAREGLCAAEPLRALVVTGGHDFHPDFYTVFEGHPDISYEKVSHPNAEPELSSERARDYDVVVLYDMYTRKPTPASLRTGLLAHLGRGKGLVVLHHAMASYGDWPEFAQIVGGRYLTEKTTAESGETLPRSTYRHDVDLRVEVADPAHPIAQGVEDFDLRDETYKGFLVAPDVHQLLRTSHESSGPIIGWCRRHGDARVVCLQPGHGPEAYHHPSYRRLVARSLRWAAGRLPPGPGGKPFRRLFNGRDLSGWERVGEASFDVQGGILAGVPAAGGRGGELLSREEFTDFELRVTFRMSWPANSGVWFRYQSPEKAYQADILEWTDPRCWSGSLYVPGKMFVSLNEDPSTVRRDGWNTLTVRAVGDYLAVNLNGCRVAEARDTASARGRVGLQVHGGDAFASMKLEVLEAMVMPIEKTSADALTLEDAGPRIERHRKGPVVVRVVGADGEPMAGADVVVRQLRHEFLFGSNIFLHGRVGPPADEQMYRRRFAEVFNFATLPFYWRNYEGERGKPAHADRERIAKWCREQSITTKGHPLVWNHPASVPCWLPADVGDIRALSEARVKDCVRRFAGLIDIWDVVNEATDPMRFQGGNLMTKTLREIGVVDLTVTSFLAAREANPNATLLINDYRTDPAYERLLSQLIHGGKRVYDAIGIQSHMHGGAWRAARVWEVCERFSRFGVPLHFTETTIVSGRRKDRGWGETEPELENVQAREVEKFYTVLFSHPAVEAITWWDFADRRAWQGAPAGFLRKDLSPKPAYSRLHKLVRDQWWTDETVRANENGEVRLRATFGFYEIEARKGDRKASTRARHTRKPGALEVRLEL